MDTCPSVQGFHLNRLGLSLDFFRVDGTGVPNQGIRHGGPQGMADRRLRVEALQGRVGQTCQQTIPGTDRVDHVDRRRRGPEDHVTVPDQDRGPVRR